MDDHAAGHSARRLRTLSVSAGLDHEVFLTSDADEAAAKLASLGVQRPKHLVNHSRDWGSVIIHETGEEER